MSRVAFVVLNNEYDEIEGYRICTIHEGYKGYYETNKFAGQDWDLATEYVQELNAAQGLTVEDVRKIVLAAQTK